MKFETNIVRMAVIGLTSGLVLGCGGGGSSNVELSPETANIMANNMAKGIPGCVYNSDSAVASSQSYEHVLKLYKTLAKRTSKQLESELSARSLSGRDINKVVTGDCSIPGSGVTKGTHENGVDNITITYDNYCIKVDDGSMTTNGVFIIKKVGKPSPTGPIPQYEEMSTNSAGIDYTEVTPKGTYTHNVKLSGHKKTFTRGVYDEPDQVEIDLLTIVDGKHNKEFELSSIEIENDYSKKEMKSLIKGLSYTDPDTGTVDIKSTPLKDSIHGDLILTGSNDTAMRLTNSKTVEGGYDVTTGGQTLGVIDCSGLAIDF